MLSVIRFGVAGVLATFTHVVVFVLVVEGYQMRPTFASVPAFLSAVGVSYVLNYRWTFAASGPHRVVFPRFLVVSITGLLLNVLTTWLIVDVLQICYGLALVAAILLLPTVTYVLSRLWVFQR